MKVLNFGDYIKKGNYMLHSKFKNVHNYNNKGEIISLVSTEIGQGPNNIVLAKIPKNAEQIIVISDQYLSIGNLSLKIESRESGFGKDIFINESAILISAIEKLTDRMKDMISQKSLGFLLFPGNAIFFQSAFDKAFLTHVKKAVQGFTLDSLPNIAKKMKGVGYGLTPSGDDFNCGILYGINYINEVVNNDFSMILEECYLNSLGKNMISNTFLKQAYLNRYYESFFKLLNAVKQKEDEEISRYLKEVINSGHTSGSDMLTGFILTVRGVLND